jgi:predicted extracellular nuclease
VWARRRLSLLALVWCLVLGQRPSADDTVPIVAIHDIQGSGATSPLAGHVVTTTGIVTGFRPGGFFMQAPDAEVDTDPETSEGVFVLRVPPPGALRGATVSVTGTVVEFAPAADPDSPKLTQIAGLPTVVVLAPPGNLPSPIELTTADVDPSRGLDVLERFEGMRVHVPSLTVVAPTQGMVTERTATAMSSGVFYGVVTGIARPFREPGIEVPNPLPPGAPDDVPRFDANAERIRVDSALQPGAPRIDVATGQVVSNLIGPLDYAQRAYAILPDPPPAPSPVVSGAVAVTPVTAPTQNQFTVASYSLQRLFDAQDDPNIPPIGSNAEPVLTALAFSNRLNKISLLVRTVMHCPDIIGLQEAENLTTLEKLATKINDDAVAAGQPSPGYVALLEEGNDAGGLDVGFLIKSARVSVISVAQEGKSDIFVAPDGQSEVLNERPPLVLRATVRNPAGAGPDAPVTVIVNHLLALSRIDHPTDGPRVREKRRAQAEFLANLIHARQVVDPDEQIVSLGNYNAFQFNDGFVDVIGTIKGTPASSDQVTLASPDLVEPDLINLAGAAPAEQRYSFVAGGNAQELDHILVTASIMPLVDGLQYGRANADFPEVLRNTATGPARISDHDPLVAYFHFPPPEISIDDVVMSEGDAGGTDFEFTVRLSAPSVQTITVDFDTRDGDVNPAKVGEDYARSTGQLIFEPGTTTQTITVQVNGDLLNEVDETFFVTLSNPGEAVITDGQGLGSILNDDPLPHVMIQNAVVRESTGGLVDAVFAVRLSEPSGLTVRVEFSTADETAAAGADYIATAGTLTFAPGEVVQTIDVPVIGDPINEANETFLVGLENAVNATLKGRPATGMIVNDDPRPRISVADASAVEPDSGTAPMTFVVRLSNPSAFPVRARFFTVNGKARAGHDYGAAHGTVTFAPLATHAAIDVSILADRPREKEENFWVVLWTADGGEIGDWLAMGTILDARPKRRQTPMTPVSR